MPRQRVVWALEEMGHLLIIAGSEAHKAPTYYRAARSVKKYPGDLSRLIADGDLRSLDGVGPTIARKIEEIGERGSFDALERLKNALPGDILSLTEIPGIGARTAGRLYRELGIENLSDLENALRNRSLRGLTGLGARREQQLEKALTDYYARRDRIPLFRALWEASDLVAQVESMPQVIETHVAGKARRRAAEIKRLSLLVVTGDGEMPSPFPAHGGEMPLDVSVSGPGWAGAALLELTGSSGHWQTLKDRALEKGMILGRTGLWQDGKQVDGEGEAAIYEALGLEFIPPELRHGRDEVSLAAKGALPVLVTAGDIKGDLHSHTTWSDGVHGIADMVEQAKAQGYRYLAVTDHSQGLSIARGLTPERLNAQGEEIELLSREYPDMLILRGSEVDIKADGSLDYPDTILSGLDVVMASVHTAFNLSREEGTRRLVAACQNPHVDIIGHPTGRVLGYRTGYEVDLSRVVEAARKTGTVLEINASPDRMDLGEEGAAEAARLGVPLAINSDAHTRTALLDLSFGLYVARRAGVSASGIMNTWDPGQIRRWLDAPKSQRAEWMNRQ